MYSGRLGCHVCGAGTGGLTLAPGRASRRTRRSLRGKSPTLICRCPPPATDCARVRVSFALAQCSTETPLPPPERREPQLASATHAPTHIWCQLALKASLGSQNTEMGGAAQAPALHTRTGPNISISSRRRSGTSSPSTIGIAPVWLGSNFSFFPFEKSKVDTPTHTCDPAHDGASDIGDKRHS